MFGYSREYVIGKTRADLKIFQGWLDRCKVIRELTRRAHLHNYEANVQDKRGDLYYGLLSAEKIYIQDSLCLPTTMIDITRSKKAEEILQESEENFRMFSETINELIIICSQNGRIIHANPAASRKL
jgi:PAS domain-containing protein